MILALATVLVPILFGAVDVGESYRGARHDPTWETRWRSLDPAEQAWLAVIATSRNWMVTLTDPEEIRLAKGRRSREGLHRLKVDLWALPVFVVAAALVLAGAMSTQILIPTLLTFGFTRNIWSYRREQQIKNALKTQRELAGETPTYLQSTQ